MTINFDRPRHSSVINYADLKSRAIDLVADKGEAYVGMPGRYFHADGSPGCLLGELLAEDGVTREEIHGVNGAGIGQLNSLGYLIPVDFKTGSALSMLQSLNDGGSDWGTAVRLTFHITPKELQDEIAARRTPKAELIDLTPFYEWVEKHQDISVSVTALECDTEALVTA